MTNLERPQAPPSWPYPTGSTGSWAQSLSGTPPPLWRRLVNGNALDGLNEKDFTVVWIAVATSLPGSIDQQRDSHFSVHVGLADSAVKVAILAGLSHPCPMEITVPSLLRIKPDALHKIGKYLRGESFNRIALYYGEDIKGLFENTIRISLETADVKVAHEEVATTNDIEAIFASCLRLPAKLDAVVAIGGGKVIDFCKYLAVLRQIPIVSVPTLISNDGFCSPFSSLLVTGQRRTVKTVIPHGVILDTNILMNCPARFMYSGIGDLFCKFSSIFDWKLAFRRKGELVNDFAAVICRNAADTFLYYPHKDFANLEYLRVIASSLLMSGVAMEIAQSSRPASGSEHLISHAYDRLAQNPSLHGLQVGVASYAVSYLQEETFHTVRACIEQSGFLEHLAANPLSKADFKEAVKRAPAVKEDFYTVLSERDAIERLLDFIDQDDLMRRMVV